MLDKDTFKEKINNHIQARSSEQVFDDNFVENLYLVLYQLPAKERTKNKRAALQAELKKEGLGTEIESAVPELGEFINRVKSPSFIETSIQEQVGKNILEVFSSLILPRTSPEKMKEKTEENIHKFILKMRNLLSAEEAFYLFSHTIFEVVNSEQLRDTIEIKIHIPVSPAEMSKQHIYIVEKMDAMLPLLERQCKKDFPTSKRSYSYIVSTNRYQQRNKEMEEKKYTLPMIRDSEEKQLNLFSEETKKSKNSGEGIRHSGNVDAYKLVDHWVKSMTGLEQEITKSISLQKISEYANTEELVGYIEQSIQKQLPFLDTEIIDMNQFYTTLMRIYDPEKKEEYKNKYHRIKKRIKKYTHKDILIIKDFEAVENKLFTQKILLQDILITGNKKTVCISNKNIATFTESLLVGKEEGKEIYQKQGIISPLLRLIKQTPTAKITVPAENEYGKIFAQYVRKHHPAQFPESLVIAIGNMVQEESLYPSILQEMIVIADGQELNKEGAIKIIKNHSQEDVYVSFEEVENIVDKYMEEENPLNQLGTLRSKQKLKWKAYLLNKIPGPKGKPRTAEEIGIYFNISTPTIKKYIQESSDFIGMIKPIEEKILHHITTKNEMKLLGY